MDGGGAWRPQEGSLGESLGGRNLHEHLLLSKDPESAKNPAFHLTENFWNRFWTAGWMGVCGNEVTWTTEAPESC